MRCVVPEGANCGKGGGLFVWEVGEFLKRTFSAWVNRGLRVAGGVSETKGLVRILGSLATEGAEYSNEVVGCYSGSLAEISDPRIERLVRLTQVKARASSRFPGIAIHHPAINPKPTRTTFNLPQPQALGPMLLPRQGSKGGRHCEG